MSIVERAGSFFLKRRLDKQIRRVERLEEKAEENGRVSLVKMDFAETQQSLAEIDSAEQEQWNETELEALEGLTNDELDKMFDVLSFPLAASLVRGWKHKLQEYKNSLG